MYQHLYSRFLKAHSGKQHFACHSHYFWPDVTRDAQIQYWDDSAKYADQKWDYFFSGCVADLQTKIAKILNAPESEQIVFAPNTHELLYRIMSCLDISKPLKILTTDSEFYSFSRQVSRLEELENVTVERVSTAPFDSFQQRFAEAIRSDEYDLVFFSQIFFNSGFAVEDVNELVNTVDNPDTLVVVDGYHGFMAVPTDISHFCDRAFYLGGSYKYAQGGEGACFAVVPKSSEHRPIYTGWYAEFGELSAAKQGEVNYCKNGMRFAGATMDLSALYRLRAVLQMFEENDLSVENINRYIKFCQAEFVRILDDLKHPQLNSQCMLVTDLSTMGHFLTYELPTADIAAKLCEHMRSHGVLTDFRGTRLRFGFGLYHAPEQYDLSCLASSEVNR